MDGGELVGAGQKLNRCRACAVQTQVHFVAMRIERCRGHTGFTRENFEPRNCDHRDFRALGEALRSAHAHTHTGKAPGAVHDDDCIEQPKM